MQCNRTVITACKQLYLNSGIRQSLDIALKGIKAVFIYNMLREGVPESNGTWEKRIQMVIRSGVRDKLRQGVLLSSNCVYRNCIFICWYTH